jgi:serine protease AprX
MSITWTRSAPVVVLGAALLSTMAVGPALAKAPKDGASAQAQSGVSGGVVDSNWGDDDTKEGRQAASGTGSWDASKDLGSMYSLTKGIGAQDAWLRGATGKDVTVALIDTGVVGVPGLDKDDKVIDGPDLSFESQSAGTRYLDGFGHGTHLAGIIAGQDDGYDPKKPKSAQFAGVAPEATLLNMKVATGDGGADVSQVIAAIDWVVEHRDDEGMNVRVINLSYGTASEQGWQVDPLARAVENAWNHDILVVAAAGNDGLDAPSLLMPAVDPHILAVGASDHRGSEAKADDVVAEFTNGGSAARRSDVLAPGKSVVSLRVPSSFVDAAHPEGRLARDAAGRFFRGSGTSQAAAVVSGEAALLFSAQPKLTAAQAKAVLMQTAAPLAGSNPAQGRGVTDIGAAVSLVKSKVSLPSSRLALPGSTGLGSLEASRGGEHVVDPETGDALTGEVDALGSPWRPLAWVTAQATDSSWVKGVWNNKTWTGTKWAKKQFQSATWTGSSWSRVPWAAHTWSVDQFQARSWRGNSWKARSWRGDSWVARSWRGNP